MQECEQSVTSDRDKRLINVPKTFLYKCRTLKLYFTKIGTIKPKFTFSESLLHST